MKLLYFIFLLFSAFSFGAAYKEFDIEEKKSKPKPLSLETSVIANKFIISFTDKTPDSSLDKIKDFITQDLAGKIVHEYSIIKGFTFSLPEGPKLESYSSDLVTYIDKELPDITYNIENDQIVTDN